MKGKLLPHYMETIANVKTLKHLSLYIYTFRGDANSEFSSKIPHFMPSVTNFKDRFCTIMSEETFHS